MNDYGSGPSDLDILIGIIVVVSISIFSILTVGQFIYHTYYCVDRIEQATILGQELVELRVAHGGVWYEYKNTILVGNNHSTIDSMELMSDFRPKDNITIRSTYRKYDMELLSIKYIRR